MASHPLIGRVVAGRYRVDRPLAHGAMGELFAAHDERTGDEVALKVIRAELVDERFRQRFEVETVSTGRLRSDHIVLLRDSGIDDGLPFLVLELLRGRDLHDALAEGTLSWRRTASILRDVAAALDVAHRGNVVHRDLKPRNIFLAVDPVTGTERVKVVDFGIARILDDGPAGPKTTTGHVLGTRGYIAPERLRGERGDARSDLYALGTLAWEMLTGHGPFVAPTQVLLAVKHLTEPAPYLLGSVDVPDDLAALVGALLEKEAQQRPATAADVVVTLERLLASQA